MLGRIVLGLVIMIAGGAMIYYSAGLTETFGRVSWAEDKLGGTRQMRMVFGFSAVVVGGLIMMGIVSLSDPTAIDTAGF